MRVSVGSLLTYGAKMLAGFERLAQPFGVFALSAESVQKLQTFKSEIARGQAFGRVATRADSSS